MDKLEIFRGLAAVMDVANVDTDQIVPQRFLKTTTKTGLGESLFFHWRYRPDGSPDPDFILNQPRYQGAQVLLAQENFGGGSSREHAPWALADYGFRVLIAPSFADIFRNNCLMSGLLLVELESSVVDEWFRRVGERPGYQITVDLPEQTLTGTDGFSCGFDLDGPTKQRLLNGLDDIDRTLRAENAIHRYETARTLPWQAAVPDPAQSERGAR
ncbi:MAG: 3-isopropylmalate dehydratase small subunit [Proteobacteria bacterium]|nr:3-isopropylmalate dehydratase small subunit [Pseudomonadota bacterium]